MTCRLLCIQSDTTVAIPEKAGKGGGISLPHQLIQRQIDFLRYWERITHLPNEWKTKIQIWKRENKRGCGSKGQYFWGKGIRQRYIYLRSGFDKSSRR